MQQLSRQSINKFTEVVLFFTRNPTKLGLHFYEFSTILYGFSKIRPKSFTMWDSILPADPWKLLQIHKYALGSHTRSWKNFRSCNWVPGAAGGGLASNPASSSASLAGEGAGEGHKPERVDSWPSLGRKACQHAGTAAVAAGAHAPAKGWHDQGNTRHGEVL
jgi:hypothetical protein